ncbi:MAG: DUF971 domain-containing protein [Pseudobacteriovorax sp.]|nr:DUF971 domain-containing protein [Pseudobacteriovorax sp.]
MSVNIQVKKIWQEDARTLGILWTTGKKSLIDSVKLREACRCALCVDEWSGESKITPGSIGDDVRPIVVQSVGRYALNVHFTDGHTTGIYTFDYLHEIF